MIKRLHGKVHGRTIQFDEDLGVADGQDVEVEVKVVQASAKSEMNPGLAKIYDILGERFNTGEHDVAELHNEHQP